MKKTYFLFLVLSLSFSLFSCKEIEDLFNKKEDPNTLGGDANTPISAVGNTFSTSMQFGNQYPNVPSNITITKKENDIATVHSEFDLSGSPELLAKFKQSIPQYIDSDGKLKVDLQYKITSEGIQDFNNKDKKALTICKYSDGVGATYEITRSDGNKLTRKITEKTGQDDFSYNMMLIKTSKIEQETRIPGIRKLVYRTNHKFGLVYVQAVFEDGTSANLYVYPKNY